MVAGTTGPPPGFSSERRTDMADLFGDDPTPVAEPGVAPPPGLEREPRSLEEPSTGDIRKERWWLDREIRLVGPRLVVALGATAVQALAGKAMPVNRNRGPILWPGDRSGYVTVHPSYLLRLQDEAEKRAAH